MLTPALFGDRRVAGEFGAQLGDEILVDRHADAALGFGGELFDQFVAEGGGERLGDRGVLAPGMRADLNVIDFDQLRCERPEIAYDLPAGSKRFLQRARGYVATMVGGELTYRDGAATGALPGKLVRGERAAAPAMAAA